MLMQEKYFIEFILDLKKTRTVSASYVSSILDGVKFTLGLFGFKFEWRLLGVKRTIKGL